MSTVDGLYAGQWRDLYRKDHEELLRAHAELAALRERLAVVERERDALLADLAAVTAQRDRLVVLLENDAVKRALLQFDLRACEAENRGHLMHWDLSSQAARLLAEVRGEAAADAAREGGGDGE